MNTVQQWLLGSSRELFPALLFLLLKITGLLALAWSFHFGLRRVNPRWRVLAWRCGAIGMMVLATLALCPPLVKLPMLSSQSLEKPKISSTTPLAATSTAQSRAPSVSPRTNLPSNSRLPQSPRRIADRETQTNAPADVPQNAKASTPSPWSWTHYLVLIYSVGAAIAFVRIALSLRRIAWIRRRTAAVPPNIEAEAAKVALALGLQRNFQLRQSSDVESPCLIGVARPTILLPPAQCRDEYRSELPPIVAHELAHLRGSDLAWNHVFAALSAFVWFHPLALRIRLAHADACDEVADAVAADYLGDGRNYGSTLARLAVRIQNPLATAGLAMARPSGIRRRVEAIQRHVFQHALPRRFAGSALALSIIAFTLLGGLALTRSIAETPKETAATPPALGGRMVIHTTLASSGEPLAGTKLEFNGTIAGQRIKTTLTTDEAGNADLKWKKAGRLQNLWMTASKPGFVPLHYVWRPDRSDVKLPETLDLAFVPGIKIGGTIRDEAGQPVAGAKVQLTMPITWPRLASYVFHIAEMKTDASGSWEFDGAPSDVAELSIRVEHSDYLPAGRSAAKSMENIVMLKQGLRIEGDIVDPSGQPIKGALAGLGFDRFGSSDPDTRTDEKGHFVLKNCKPGQSLVTVQADGLSPQAQEVTVGDKNAPLKFALEPGHTMKARVVDINGKPVKGAFFAADTWRGYRSLKFRIDSPADGRVTWKGAPAESILYDIGKTGYMSARGIAIKPDGEEHLVTLYPILEISGRVTDKQTGKPIENFQITNGYQFANSSQTYWSRDAAIPCEDGLYTYKFDEPMKAYLLQVTAAGYKPATSRIFETTEGKVTFDFELDAGSGPTGIILLPDGKPATGAKVGLATSARHAMLDKGHFDRNQNQAEVVETDTAGRFTFVPQDCDDFLLLVLHDSGFAQVSADELKSSQEIKLKPWGRIEGRALVGQKPDAGREVTFQPHTAPEGGRSFFNFVFSYGYQTNADKDGRFVFDRVIPGPGSISRVVITEFIKSQQHAPGWSQKIDVRPNETTNVTVGGTGRPVTGTLALDRDPGFQINWTTNEPAAIQLWNKTTNQAADPFTRFLGNFDKSGRFEIPDVPAGDYKLVFDINSPPVPNSCGAGEAIGKAELPFTIPEMPGGRSDEPLDLGSVTGNLFDTLDVGETAPDFVAERLDGGRTRLTDLRGKLVLVDFWATWCGPCIAEMPSLKLIQKSFGDNPHFALLGIACDDDAATAKKFVDANELNWQHVHVRGTISKIASDYTVRAIPATFLIGPDGRMLAKNLRGEDLQKAVAAALANADSFRGGQAPPPPRFPVVRFEAPTAPSSTAGLPAVVVADDCDPNFEKGQPHTDGLSLLDDNGKVLWNVAELNNCQTVGGIHAVAIDRERGRIYACEMVGHRLLAFDRAGRKLWQIENAPAECLAVDEKTGNLWISGGNGRLDDGETVVFDLNGKEVASFPQRAIDMAYDPHTDAFWLVGYGIWKLDRDGKVLFHKPVDGWCYPAVAVNPTDGSAWIAERDHPDEPRSKNRLWLLKSDGTVRLALDRGKDDVFTVACDPKTGDAWSSGYNSGLRRITPAGKVGDATGIIATNIAISPTTGTIWASTADAVLKLDTHGQTLTTAPHRAKSAQSWIAAF